MKAKCDNCEESFNEDELEKVKDYSMRVDAGGEVPAGQCPECGALCYVIKTASASHTPGPWKYTTNVGPTRALIVESDGSTVVELRINVRDSRLEANARLIAAAPDLLETLKACRAAMASLADQVEQMKDMFDDEDGAIKDALADAYDGDKIALHAITNAEGKR